MANTVGEQGSIFDTDGKIRKMWCKCGAGHFLRAHRCPSLLPCKALTWEFSGADDGIRTRDPHLGKVMLYQLSHVRLFQSDSSNVR